MSDQGQWMGTASTRGIPMWCRLMQNDDASIRLIVYGQNVATTDIYFRMCLAHGSITADAQDFANAVEQWIPADVAPAVHMLRQLGELFRGLPTPRAALIAVAEAHRATHPHAARMGQGRTGTVSRPAGRTPVRVTATSLQRLRDSRPDVRRDITRFASRTRTWSRSDSRQSDTRFAHILSQIV